MDNVVTINNQKTNTLELDVSVQGIDTADIRVWLSIAAEGMELCFECTREGGGEKWAVVVPPLPFITRTAYPCAVKIVADGYYFEPLNGTMNVTGDAEVYSSTPANVTFKPKTEGPEEKKDDDKKVEVTETKTNKGPAHQPKTKSREKGIDQIAKELLEANKSSDKPEDKKDDKAIAKKVKPLTERQKKRAEKKKDAADALRAKKVQEDADKKAEKSKQIDETVEAIKAREKARKEKDVVKPVVVPVVEDVKKDVKKVEPKVEPVVEAKTDAPVEEKIDEKIVDKKADVKKVLAEAKAKAKKATKKKRAPRKKPEIPKKEIQDFKLRPKKIDPKKAAEKIDETKNTAIKAILEDLGVNVDKPQNFVVKTSAKRSAPDAVDLEKVAKDLMEKSKSDPKNVEKKEAAEKAAQIQEVVSSEKDSEVMAILEEIGIKPEGAKNVPRVSFIKKDAH